MLMVSFWNVSLMAMPPHCTQKQVKQFHTSQPPMGLLLGLQQKHVGSGQSSIGISTCTKNIGNKWKNDFFKMKRDIGMAQSSKKEGNKEWLLSKAT